MPVNVAFLSWGKPNYLTLLMCCDLLLKLYLRYINHTDDTFNLDYVYTTQDGEEFVIPIQYLNDEQMYKLVTYLQRITEVL